MSDFRIIGKPKGSVFARKTSIDVKKLYYKSPFLGNKQIATGLVDNKSNRKIIWELLKKIQLKYEYGIDINKPSKMTLFQCFNKFIEVKSYLGKTHRNTISNYRFAFKAIFENDFIVDQKEDKGYKSYYQIEDVIYKFVSKSKLKPNSIRIYLRAIRVFINWLTSQGYIENISINEYFPPEEQKEIQVYSEDDYFKILNYFRDRGRNDIVDLITFMIHTGSRTTEALRLQWNDVDLVKKTVKFPKKNKRHIIDIIPINQDTVELLLKLKDQSMKRQKNQNKVFHWSEGTRSKLIKNLNECLNHLGIKKVGSAFHPTRKSHLTNLFKRNVDLVSLKRLARHSDLSVTEKHYLENDLEKLRDYL